MDTRQFSSEFLVGVDKLWNYVVISVSDKDIKIANIVLAFVAVYFCSKYYKRILRMVVCKFVSTQYEEDQVIIERIISIFFGSMLVILILQISNIPLNTFAFLGGAFVLGFGLGVQNIINNLLSGFVLIIEKPIKVGDLVSVDGQTGVVKKIGGRCVTIINSFNAAVVIPNSVLVQNKLTNWSGEGALDHSMKVKILKRVNQGHDSQECLKILQDVFAKIMPDQEFSAYLSAVTVSYYVYSMSYKLYAQSVDSSIRGNINTFLLQKLGPDVIIEYTEKPQ